MKKALCILLSLIMLLSASTTAFASEMIDKSFCIDDYKHRLTRAHRGKQLKMSCQALHNAPPNRT